jgi:hypothetical protein
MRQQSVDARKGSLYSLAVVVCLEGERAGASIRVTPLMELSRGQITPNHSKATADFGMIRADSTPLVDRINCSVSRAHRPVG